MVAHAPNQRTRFLRLGQAWHARTGLSWMGTLSLASVVLVLVVVSLPRLRSFAQTENEADARATARLLANELAGSEAATIEDLSRRDPVARALNDAEFLASGRLLRRHGYLFAVVPVAAGAPPPPRPGLFGPGEVLAADEPAPRRGVLAWPWQRGRTGHAAWLATARGSFRHENAGAPWSGTDPAAGRAITSWEGWRRAP